MTMMLAPSELDAYTTAWIPVLAARILEGHAVEVPRFSARACCDLERRTDAWLRLRGRWIGLLSAMPAPHAARLDRCIAWRDNELAQLGRALDHVGAALADGSRARAEQALQTYARSHQCWEAFLVELRALAWEVDDVTALVYGPTGEVALAA